MPEIVAAPGGAARARTCARGARVRPSRILLPAEPPVPTHRVALLALTSLLGCGTTGAGGTTTTAPAPTSSPAATTTPAAPAAPRRVARGGANLITNAEIEAAPPDVNNAYEIIERLRPTMLRPRNLSTGGGGEGSEYGIVAYVDDVRLPTLDQLKTVMRGSVREIRYVSATDATTRWGTGHSNGAILVVLKR